MKFYGIKREKLIERIQYEKAKAITFLKPFLEINKENRDSKKEWYNRIFKNQNRFRLDISNSIPLGGYFVPVSVITFELIAKEDIKRLKNGIERLIIKNTSHKFMGGMRSWKDMIDSIDNLFNENLFSNNTWLECGRFDFDQNKTISRQIDYFDLKLINFSTSYVAVEIHIYLTEDRKKQVENIVNQNYREERGVVFEHFSRNAKARGAKRSITVQRYNNSFLKSELLSDLMIETKWYLYDELSKFIPFILHNKGIIPPSLNLYKTNLVLSQEEDMEFWDSIGGSWFKGQTLSSSETIFFEPNLSAKPRELQRNDILIVINEDTYSKKEGYYSFDFQATIEMSEKTTNLLKLIIVKTLNGFFISLGAEYRNNVNKIRMKKRFLKRLLKLRFQFESDFVLFKRIKSEVDWEKEKVDSEGIFPDDTDESKIQKYHRVITEFPLVIQERIEKVRLDIENILEQKLTITGHINDYINLYKNYRLNVTMLLIAGATFIFVLYPEWAKKLVLQINNMFQFLF
ncbi:hypothetical protein [Paenibacillus tianjinensis]|uniref:ApeA N-terminal domain-containing protein n=1 Tax=Paenibacillus tianjinensis TaxID=2810347 RepID=A0ABX7LDJ4_9BACL|nr:hypothetical protein [Paenibacillus tianjinensis]QSF46194.1 hypothetical protein JRJ22_06170 [Paenibacillus tianjinensis]